MIPLTFIYKYFRLRCVILMQRTFIGTKKSITKALKDNLSEHLGTIHYSIIFEHLKMLKSCKIQKYLSHLAMIGRG